MQNKKTSLDEVSDISSSNNSTRGKAQKNKKNSTLKDVANAAGISKSTVSRAFNYPDKVKNSTLKLVRKKAKEIGYVPNRVAKRLQAGDGKAMAIGLIIPDLLNPFFAEITLGIEDVALKNGYALIFNNSHENEDRQRLCLDTLRMEGVDGIILPPVNKEDEYVKEFIENGLNIVLVDRLVDNISVDAILSDNRKGAYLAVSHLIKLGHKRIAYIGGIESITSTEERLQGYKIALKEYNIKVDDSLILIGDSKHGSGERLTRELLSKAEPPTAIFTGNNMTTLGAYIACNQLGVKIPDDIAIVGYDDVPWAEALTPAPTVIDQSTYEVGQRAAEQLLYKIENPNASPITIQITPKLIVRESCGASKKNNG